MAVNARPFRVLVCGGRKFTDKALVYRTLDALAAEHGVLYVIEGGARGADALARTWRHDKLQPGKTFHADWTRYGDAAGPMRNRKMLVDGQPDLVLAFPGGDGTADMMRQATAFRCPVEQVR
jgi:SLOG family YspA-like protein